MFAQGILNVKPASRTAYSRNLKPFLIWAAETGRNIGDMKPQDVNAYREHLLTRRGVDGAMVSPLTVTAYVGAVRKFYAWTEDTGLHPNVAQRVKGAKREDKFQRRHLTREQATRLLTHYAGNLRDLAIIRLALQTGMRTAEIVSARVGGLKIVAGKYVLNFQGKGRDHDRDYVILGEKTRQAILDYLAADRPNFTENEPLFTSRSNRNQKDTMTTRSIRRIVEDGMKAIGLIGREYTAHSLRHTAAVTMLKLGASIDEVRGELRHRSTETTRIYLKNIEEEERLNRATSTILDEAF